MAQSGSDFAVNSVAADFGDPRGEFLALLHGCGVFHLGGRGKIALTGDDRVRWLNGMVTNNIRDLAVGRGLYALLLNPQGKILGDLYAYNRGNDILLDTDRSQLEKMLPIFDHYIIMDDVEVANVSDKVSAIAMAGPLTDKMLKTSGIDTDGLGPLELRDVHWQGARLTLVRGEDSNHPYYEVWGAPGDRDGFLSAMIRTGATPVGASAVEWRRIALGIPRYGVDIRERDLPQETEQMRALNFSKGCYVGQEIVERIRSRGAVHRKFTGFTIEGTLPGPGTRLQLDGKDVAEITSSASLPVDGRDFPVALGYVRRDVGMPGKALVAGDVKATVSELPFKMFRE